WTASALTSMAHCRRHARVRARAAVEDVAVPAAAQRVVAATTEEAVPLVATLHDVVARTTSHEVPAVPAVRNVVAPVPQHGGIRAVGEAGVRAYASSFHGSAH